VKTRYGNDRLLIGLASSLWLGFATAHAAQITEVVPFSINASMAANLPPETTNVLTPQFNPALGTFQSGTTIITGTISLGLEFFGTGAAAPYDVVLDDTLSLGGIPGRFAEELTGTVPANQAVFITPTMTFGFGPVERGDVPEQVVGTGTWNQVFSLPFPSLTLKQSPSAVLPGINITGSSATTYTYTPVLTAVPEPRMTGILVLLLGIGLITAGRSKEAKRRRPGTSHA
jgi:hypothetical protein